MQPENDDDTDNQEAVEWLESMNRPTQKRKPTSLWSTLLAKVVEWLRSLGIPKPKQGPPSLSDWDSLLAERNTYKAAYQIGGVNLLVSLVFCELLTAHCIEVQPQLEEGKPKHLYRIKDEVDFSLLNEIEQVIARSLIEFCDYRSLLEQASDELAFYKGYFPAQQSSSLIEDQHSKDVRKLAEQYQKIIHEALLYNPMVVTSGGCQ
jgi:hypothetical protein